MSDDAHQPIFTIGHSNFSVAHIVDLLKTHGIQKLIDVRSRPYSRHNPQFNRESLEEALHEAGIGYGWLGRSLGGMRDAIEYDGEGNYRTDVIARSGEFQEGLDILQREAEYMPIAIMCAEEDPNRCHRRTLITPFVVAAGVDVRHIRGDGALQTETDLREAENHGQMKLTF